MNKGGFDIRKYSFLLTQARAAKLDFKNLDKEQFVRDFRQILTAMLLRLVSRMI